MSKLAKWHNNILQVFLILLPILWLLNIESNRIVNYAINSMLFIFIAFTVFLSIFTNKNKKKYSYYIFMIVYILIIIIFFCIRNRAIELSDIVSMMTMVIFPLSIVIVNSTRISNRSFGFITSIMGIFGLLHIGDLKLLADLSLLVVPLIFILLYFEDNLLIKLIYIFTNIFLINLIFNKLYIIIFIILAELIIAALEYKRRINEKIFAYFFIYVLGFILIAFDYVDPTIPFTFFMAMIVNKGFIKDKYNLLFTSNDLSIGGIETSLVNLLNGIDFNIFNVTLILENKKGELLKNIKKEVYIKRYKVFNTKLKIFNKAVNFSKRIIFSIFNYHTYDFSCCYATYSYCGNKLSKIASLNSSIYVHSNYKYVYKDINDTKSFFDTRKMNEFRRIVFVSNESRDDYLELYPDQKNKTLVINNFIDLDIIEKKKKERLGFNKYKNKKLLVFVGRLDEESKKITRIIEIAHKVDEVSVWIIGDGKDKEKYKELIKKYKLGKKVLMFGSITAPYNYMDRADYIILTSDYEGFPVVYLEALALNKEIITTFPVSDERIDIKQRAHIISKDNYIEDIREVLKNKETKNSEINLKEVQYLRRRKLEKLFKGVI